MRCLKKENEVYHCTDYMSTFGDGYDLYISNDCNINTTSNSNLGHNYELPNGYTYGSTQA